MISVTRAAALIARVEWPGKPGTVAVTPLTPAEQQRFTAGQEVYRNVCQACHQPDGRGMDKIAPTLVGSAFALANPDVPVRILLHGKEGTVGMMPPVGQTFTDEQIAAVLTYIRREWGQTGLRSMRRPSGRCERRPRPGHGRGPRRS